jgi:hypothetical protein
MYVNHDGGGRATVTDFFAHWRPYSDLKKSVLRKGVRMRHEPSMLVNGHYRGTGTYIFYVPKKGVFYLWTIKRCMRLIAQ